MKTPLRLPAPRLFALLCLSLAALPGCPVPVVTPEPVPSSDRLRTADCAPAATLYRKHLETMQPATQGAWEPARIAAHFQKECETRLAGKARRIVIRCWSDAPTAKDFVACNDRF